MAAGRRAGVTRCHAGARLRNGTRHAAATPRLSPGCDDPSEHRASCASSASARATGAALVVRAACVENRRGLRARPSTPARAPHHAAPQRGRPARPATRTAAAVTRRPKRARVRQGLSAECRQPASRSPPAPRPPPTRAAAPRRRAARPPTSGTLRRGPGAGAAGAASDFGSWDGAAESSRQRRYARRHAKAAGQAVNSCGIQLHHTALTVQGHEQMEGLIRVAGKRQRPQVLGLDLRGVSKADIHLGFGVF